MFLKRISSFVFFIALFYTSVNGLRIAEQVTGCGCVKVCTICTTPEMAAIIKVYCPNQNINACYANPLVKCQKVNGQCEWIRDTVLTTCLANVPVLDVFETVSSPE